MSLLNKFHIIIPPQDLAENAECFSKVAKGDREAFEWLYKNYCQKVYDLAVLLTGNTTMSEDIVHDVFLRIWLHKENLQGISNFNHWLHTVTKNCVMDFWRRTKIEKKHTQAFADLQAPIDQPEHLDKENKALIIAAIDSLSQRQRSVYTLIREEGLKRETVSKALSISPCTVKATMQNALYRIKNYVRERLEE